MSEQALSSSQAEENVYELMEVIDPKDIFELTSDLKVDGSGNDADLLDGLSDDLSNYSNDDTENAAPQEEHDTTEHLDKLIDELDDDIDHGLVEQGGELDFSISTEHDNVDKSSILDDLDSLDALDDLDNFDSPNTKDDLDNLDDFDPLADLDKLASELDVQDDEPALHQNENTHDDIDESSLDELTAAIAKKRQEFNSSLDEEPSSSENSSTQGFDIIPDYEEEPEENLDDLLASLDNISASADIFDSEEAPSNNATIKEGVPSLDSLETSTIQNFNQLDEELSLADLEKISALDEGDSHNLEKKSANDLLSDLDSLFENEVVDLVDIQEQPEELSQEHIDLIEDITNIDDVENNVENIEDTSETTQETEAESLGISVPVFAPKNEDIFDEMLDIQENLEENFSEEDIPQAETSPTENQTDLDIDDFLQEDTPTDLDTTNLEETTATSTAIDTDDFDDFDAQLDAELGGGSISYEEKTITDDSGEIELGQGAIDFAAIDPESLNPEELDNELLELQGEFDTESLLNDEELIESISDFDVSELEENQADIANEAKESIEKDLAEASPAENLEFSKPVEAKTSHISGDISEFVELFQPITKMATEIAQASHANIAPIPSAYANIESTNAQAQFNLLFSEFRLLSAELNDLKRKQNNKNDLGFTSLSAEPSYEEIETNLANLRDKLAKLDDGLLDTRGDFQLLSSEVAAQAEGDDRLTVEKFIYEMTEQLEKHALRIVAFENKLTEIENANAQMDMLMTQVRTKVEKNTAKIELLASRLDNIENSLSHLDSMVAAAAAKIIREEIAALLEEDALASGASLAMPQTQPTTNIEDYNSLENLDNFDTSPTSQSLNSNAETIAQSIANTSSYDFQNSETEEDAFISEENEPLEEDFFATNQENNLDEADFANDISLEASANFNVTTDNAIEDELVFDLPESLDNQENLEQNQADPFDEMEAMANMEVMASNEVDPFEDLQMSAEAPSDNVADMLDDIESMNIEADSRDMDNQNAQDILDDFDMLSQSNTANVANSDTANSSVPPLPDKDSLLQGILYNLKDYKD